MSGYSGPITPQEQKQNLTDLILTLHDRNAGLRADLQKAQERIAELEKAATDVRRDLILRAEPDWDGSGQKVVNLSAGIWDELNRVLNIKGNRREGK